MKTGRPKVDQRLVDKGRVLIQEKDYSVRAAALEVGLAEATLRRRLKVEEKVNTPKDAKIRELKFKRIFSFQIIPRYLFAQVKENNDWDLDFLYDYADDLAKDPLTLIYVLADKDYQIKGVLWAAINPLVKTISGYLLSVDKEYQDRGSPILYAIEFLTEIKEKIGFKKIEWPTTRPRAFERLGFKRSGITNMEV